MKNMKKYLPDNKISMFPWQTESSLGLSVKFIFLLLMSSLIIFTWYVNQIYVSKLKEKYIISL